MPGSVQYRSAPWNDRNSDLELILSIQYALVFIPGLVIGRLFDMGIYKMPIFLASVMLVVCTILVAQCKEYWQFLLCQGIAVGVSNLRTALHAMFSLQ